MRHLVGFLIIFFVFVVNVDAQDSRPLALYTRKNTNYEKSYINNDHRYPGWFIPLDKGIIRIRLYDDDAVQFTYIIGKKYQIRFYTYLTFPEVKVTNAISFKFYFNEKGVSNHSRQR